MTTQEQHMESAGSNEPRQSEGQPSRALPELNTVRPTIAEIARRAGVNKSTVSRALRQDPSIPQATRQRIQDLAAQLNYVPNASARHLNHARTDTIALVSRALNLDTGAGNADPFLVELLAGIADEAAGHHLDVLLVRAEEGERELGVYQRILGGRHADGVILTDLRPNDHRLAYLCRHRYPHVLFGRSAEDLAEARLYPYPWAEVDNRSGARIGTEHLLSLGHRRIAFIGGGDTYHWERDRRAGYREALAGANLPYDPRLCIPSGISQKDGYLLTQQLLSWEEPPTAIFAISDVLAVGVMRAALDAGVQVGPTFSVIGFDGLGLGSYLTPPLTTLRQPINEVGRILVHLLWAVLHGAPPEEPYVFLQPELIVRASTRGY
ncbi:LacI family DNA-binding transcriptional regulator [Thermogemmatispora carboxidivorans]|uniref:LacI family DNA-binding transcriptional regulator n=1 Tax=Thermogemmatispora carboxidivorans TaxID=1382306 RepID=UPI0009E05F05|nr:LacI family DNA-binding transcriptional regulator [Thermogemmatispora carboxidivorans]